MALKPVMVDNIFFEMNFGKHKGKTVGEIFEIEPSYLVWAHETCGHFTLSDDMYTQALDAKLVAYKKHWFATSIEKGLSMDQATIAFIKKFKEKPSEDFIYEAIYYGMDHLSETFKSHTHPNTNECITTGKGDGDNDPPWGNETDDLNEAYQKHQELIKHALEVPAAKILPELNEKDDECPF